MNNLSHYYTFINFTWISFKIETFIITSGVLIEVAKLDNVSTGESKNLSLSNF